MATTVHDVLRYLIRNSGHANTAVERDLLLTVDGDEQGYKDLESYKEVLAQKEREEAAAARAVAAGPQEPSDTTAGLSDDQLAAELDRRKALAAAQAGNRPATSPPIHTVGTRTPADDAAISRLEAIRASQGGSFSNSADQVELARLQAIPPAPVNPTPIS